MDQQILSQLLFLFTIIILLLLDLGLFNKNNEVISLRKSCILSIFYVSIACFFGLYIYYSLGIQSASEYFTGFLLEKTMSLDNIFVISIIFSFFKIPTKYQHRILFYGILGVILLRGAMIYAGASIISNFSWVLFIFAFILIITGVKTFIIAGHASSFNIDDTYIYKLLRSNLRIHTKLIGDKFFVTIKNKLFVTPCFMALLLIEFMDVIFALDSIPVIFAVTQNPYIVYTSNIFAILGLRALFFLLSHLVKRFEYIKYSLSIILILIGIKIFIAHLIYIPTYIPLLVTFLLLLAGVFISLIYKPGDENI